MKLIIKRPIAFFDLETTGLDVQKDRIVEIAVVTLFPDLSKQTWVQRVNPEMLIPQGAIDTHGITNEMAAEYPVWAKIAPLVYEKLEGCDIGGYNSNRYDVPLLYHEFRRAGIAWNYTKHKLIDVKVIYFEKERRRLIDAVKLYLGIDLENAHSAEADIEATVDVFLAQMNLYDDLPNNVEDLALFCNSGQKQADISGKLVYDGYGNLLFNFGKNAGKEIRSDMSYLRWFQGSDFPEDSKKIIKDYLTINPLM